jgi:hypothetical protein
VCVSGVCASGVCVLAVHTHTYCVCTATHIFYVAEIRSNVMMLIKTAPLQTVYNCTFTFSPEAERKKSYYSIAVPKSKLFLHLVYHVTAGNGSVCRS